MSLPRGTFPAAGLFGAAAALAGAVAFVLAALEPRTGAAAVFATVLLCLVAAASWGPFLFVARDGDRRWTPAVRGLLRAAALGGAGAVACGATALLRDGPAGAAAACGLLGGLLAFAAGAVAWMLGGGPARVAVAAAALVSLATLFFWDDAFLRRAEDRRASATLAWRLNAATAASATVGYDWIHAPEVYRGSETAESLGVGVPLDGAGSFALRLAPWAAAAALAGLWRKP